MPNLPPLNALKAFEAAGRLGSFKHAAGELGVSPGAVSRHVALLEHWVGTPLFDRFNRRLELTPEGAAYLHEVGPALHRIAAASRRSRERRGRRTLRVDATSTFALRWLVPRLGMFGRDHPGIEVRLSTVGHPLDEGEPYDVLIRGGLDTVYGFQARPFLPETRAPVCSPALVRAVPLRVAADLAAHTLLHAATLSRIWGDWLRAAGVPDLEPAGSLLLDHFFLTLQAAIDGLGVAVGPCSLVAGDVATGRLVFPFAGPVLTARGYCAYVLDPLAQDPSASAFCRWLEEEGAATTRQLASGLLT